MQAGNLLITPIPLETNCHTKFPAWNIDQLFLHISFTEAKNQDVCESNESIHKLGKKYPMNDCDFDIGSSRNND
jgi:hypothetical protein